VPKLLLTFFRGIDLIFGNESVFGIEVGVADGAGADGEHIDVAEVIGDGGEPPAC